MEAVMNNSSGGVRQTLQELKAQERQNEAERIRSTRLQLRMRDSVTDEIMRFVQRAKAVLEKRNS